MQGGAASPMLAGAGAPYGMQGLGMPAPPWMGGGVMPQGGPAAQMAAAAAAAAAFGEAPSQEQLACQPQRPDEQQQQQQQQLQLLLMHGSRPLQGQLRGGEAGLWQQPCGSQQSNGLDGGGSQAMQG